MSDLLLSDSVTGAERDIFTSTLKAPNMWSLRRWDDLIGNLPLRDSLSARDWSAHTVLTFQKVLANLEQVREEFVGRVGPEIVKGTFDRLSIQHEAAKAGKLGWCFYALLR